MTYFLGIQFSCRSDFLIAILTLKIFQIRLTYVNLAWYHYLQAIRIVKATTQLRGFTFKEIRITEKKPVSRPLNGFITYSHEDIEAKNELRRRLAVMEQQNQLVTWDDGQLTLSDKALQSKDVIETNNDLITETSKASGFLDYKDLLGTHYLQPEGESVNIFDLS